MFNDVIRAIQLTWKVDVLTTDNNTERTWYDSLIMEIYVLEKLVSQLEVGTEDEKWLI